MNAPVVEQTNMINATAARRFVGIQADESGKLPERIELVKAGVWIDSWKGNLEITISDLMEMKANLDAGVGLADNGSAGAPLDYSHYDGEKAAGWLKEFAVEGDTLVCTKINWTPAGKQSVIDGEFMFISPSFYPACLGSWQDPENPTIMARNVVVGAGLTNRPFFKDLKGVKASESENGNQRELFISASQKGTNMTKTLEEVRVLEASALTDEDKKTLVDNKALLTADERVKFSLDEDVTQAPAPAVAPVDADATKLEASIKAGTHVVVPTAEFNAIKASAEANSETIKKYERERIDADVAKHVARGAIKADSAEQWGNKVEADASVAELLKSLPDNQLLASELGDDNTGDKDAVKVLTEKINEAVKASVVDGKETLSISDATSQVRNENPDLAKAYDEQIKNV